VISLALVTHNRSAIVVESLRNVLETGLVDDVVWYDNASDPREHKTIADTLGSWLATQGPESRVWSTPLAENRGAAWALNRSWKNAKNDLILTTDGDMLVGAGDLALMQAVLERDPKRLAVSIYCQPVASVPERFRGPAFHEGGAELARGLPLVTMLFRRELLELVGWRREDFGLCEWDDNEWAERAMHHATLSGFELLAFRDRTCAHIPDRDKSLEPADYWDMKVRERSDPSKVARIHELRNAGFPKFNPWQP